MSAPSAPKLTIDRKNTFGMVVSSSNGSVSPASSTCAATMSTSSTANAAHATVAAARFFRPETTTAGFALMAVRSRNQRLAWAGDMVRPVAAIRWVRTDSRSTSLRTSSANASSVRAAS